MIKKVKAEGTLEDFSEEQMSIVHRLREELADRLAPHPDLVTTWNLLRFCRARDFNYDKVRAMLQGFIDFRENLDYERVKQLDIDYFKPMAEYYARGYVGYDYEGRLVMIEKISKSNPRELFKRITEDQMTEYLVNLYERLLYVILPVLSLHHNRRIDRTVLIIDLSDVNLLKLFDGDLKTFLKFSSKMSQDYYPELLGKSFIINAPWVFKGIWSIVKIWLDKRTTEKFVIDSGPASDKLAECMDIRILPTDLGGESTEPLTDFTGIWKDELLDAWSRKSFHLKDRTPEYEYFYTESERAKVMPLSKAKETTATVSRNDLSDLQNESVTKCRRINSFRPHLIKH
jgi:hypothetical protein